MIISESRHVGFQQVDTAGYMFVAKTLSFIKLTTKAQRHKGEIKVSLSAFVSLWFYLNVGFRLRLRIGIIQGQCTNRLLRHWNTIHCAHL